MMKIGTIIKVKKKWCKGFASSDESVRSLFGNRNAIVFDLTPIISDYGVMFSKDIKGGLGYWTLHEKDIKEIIWTP